MNIQNCQKCNFPVDAAEQFCKNCGTPKANAEPDLPPTVVGMMPPVAPNQFQPQPQIQPNQPAQMPPPQQQYEPQINPPKSGGKKFLVIGGIVGLIVIFGIGFLVWANVINPYLKKQARLKKESDNQTLASSMNAMNLLPNEFKTISTGVKFQKERTMDSLQLLQASQNLPKELKEAVKDIKDAAAAEYGTAGSSDKASLQIFKYDTPAKAFDTCKKVSGELEKNKSAFEKVTPFSPWIGITPSRCQTTAEGKNGQYISVDSFYGFLYVTSGRKEPAMGASLKVTFDLAR